MCLSVYLPLCLPVCLPICPPPAIIISENSKTISITFEKVTTLVPRMHHVLIILTLTFIQSDTGLNHENNQYSIIIETVQAVQVCC